MRRRYLVTYDVSDDKRRNRIFQTLMDRGDHVQYSVFLCELDAREHASLKGELQQYVHCREDQVLLLDLGSADNPLEIGQGLESIGLPYRPPQRVVVV
ncbi:MAG TPA: CRISPR-associated endonuclease Cas2 [Halothiobacillaceae bacterium]|nr:CRISPR-associated endonuclease Cas2 [Halothiobacillaceae bacterium]